MEDLNIAPQVLTYLSFFSLMGMGLVFAHCNTMDGPIIKDAQKALEAGNVDLVLRWIQERDEAELKQAFLKAREVRTLNPAAEKLADQYFIETFVRLHRAGEGAPYTGIEPSGTPLNPAVEKADIALERGNDEDLLRFMSDTIIHGIRNHYGRAKSLKKHSDHNVQAGREYAEAYVEYVHYVEKLYEDATAPKTHHGHTGLSLTHEH